MRYLLLKLLLSILQALQAANQTNIVFSIGLKSSDEVRSDCSVWADFSFELLCSDIHYRGMSDLALNVKSGLNVMSTALLSSK